MGPDMGEYGRDAGRVRLVAEKHLAAQVLHGPLQIRQRRMGADGDGRACAKTEEKEDESQDPSPLDTKGNTHFYISPSLTKKRICEPVTELRPV